MNEKEKVSEHVEQCQLEGKWIDRGRWVPGGRQVPEYWPTQKEIASKCRLLRTRDGRHGAHARAPRGGKHAVANAAEMNRLLNIILNIK
jgi:hypothetical protein